MGCINEVSLNTWFRSSQKCDSISLILMAGYLDIVLIILHRQLLIDWWLLLVRLLLKKYGGNVGCHPDDMYMSGVDDAINNDVLIFIPIPWFVIALVQKQKN